MRVPRVFTDRTLAAGAQLELDERAARYISQVLRLRPGMRVVLFNGDGHDHNAELTRCDRRACTVKVGSRVASEPSADLHLHLGVGISRGERMDLVVQKSVELGVHAITPLLTERNVVQLSADRQEKRLAHWQGVLTSACEQSGRSTLPALHAPCRLDDWLQRHPRGLMLHHEAGTTLAALASPGPSLNLLIGPEGGLTEPERMAAGRAGFTAVRLGPRILRTETAPLAALAAIQVLWGDFR